MSHFTDRHDGSRYIEMRYHFSANAEMALPGGVQRQQVGVECEKHTRRSSPWLLHYRDVMRAGLKANLARPLVCISCLAMPVHPRRRNKHVPPTAGFSIRSSLKCDIHAYTRRDRLAMAFTEVATVWRYAETVSIRLLPESDAAVAVANAVQFRALAWAYKRYNYWRCVSAVSVECRRPAGPDADMSQHRIQRLGRVTFRKKTLVWRGTTLNNTTYKPPCPEPNFSRNRIDKYSRLPSRRHFCSVAAKHVPCLMAYFSRRCTQLYVNIVAEGRL